MLIKYSLSGTILELPVPAIKIQYFLLMNFLLFLGRVGIMNQGSLACRRDIYPELRGKEGKGQIMKVCKRQGK